MKFHLHAFLDLVGKLAPVVLSAVPGGDKIAPLIPVITHAVTEAEQIKGASGADKKAHVLNVVDAAVTTLNATGKVKLDPAEVQAISANGIDAVIGAVHVVADAHTKAGVPLDAPGA